MKEIVGRMVGGELRQVEFDLSDPSQARTAAKMAAFLANEPEPVFDEDEEVEEEHDEDV